MAPTQPSNQQRRKNNREQDPNDHTLEGAAQRERRRERTAPVAVRNRTLQVSRIAARPQFQRVASIASDEHALRELNRCPPVLTIPELAAHLERLLKLGSAVRLQAAYSRVRVERDGGTVLADAAVLGVDAVAPPAAAASSELALTPMASARSAVTLTMRSG
jgi:hypothetical protein